MTENYMDQHFENWRPAVRRFGFMTVGVLIGIIIARIIPMNMVMGIIVPVLMIVAVGITVSIVALTVWDIEKGDKKRV